MLISLLILVVGLTPSILSIWWLRRADARARERLRWAIQTGDQRGLSTLRLPPDVQYVEGLGYIVGDFTCQFNARSSYLRCAVNPSGPCQDCRHYQPKPLEGEQSSAYG